MKRWDWLGPAIGVTFYVTGLTSVVLGPIEDVFFGFSDPVKFLLTVIAATIATGIVAQTMRRRRRKLVAAKAQLARWEPPEEAA